MGDIQTRPFSKNYSGLINQSVIAVGISVLCVTAQELMKRKRRGRQYSGEGLGSRESWEFGYLYQGRCWAKDPSPPSHAGWPLSWVKQVVDFPEAKMNELRGVDATLYVRFLRGCFWFSLLHTFTTLPILFPIHVRFSDDGVSPKSMTRASISSLVATAQGLSLLWIHICLLFWITLTWMGTLIWLCHGAFRLRTQKIDAAKQRAASVDTTDKEIQYHSHPHPPYSFQDIPSPDQDRPNAGLRLRTVMVSNVPPQLRHEKELKEYFVYYMSRKLDKPSVGLTSSTQPGFINKSLAFLFNRAKRLPVHLPSNPLHPHAHPQPQTEAGPSDGKEPASAPISDDIPVIECVTIARKMTELASLLERREEMLRLLETAHIKLAKKALLAVSEAMDRKSANKPLVRDNSKAIAMAKRRKAAADVELGVLDEEERMEQLIEVLGPYVKDFGLRAPRSARARKALSITSKHAFRRLRMQGSSGLGEGHPDVTSENPAQAYPPPLCVGRKAHQEKTIWEALLSLPRSSLDAYQPLVSLSQIFRGKTVPSIDYYTAKLNLLTSLITENRAKAVNDYDPVSTAFVTFASPSDARRACKYLAVHPNNPLACMVTMAPAYQDLDWTRVMKSSFNAEFVKDWVVNLGVWAFTVFWLFPVSLLVGLVSIQNISVFWPGLKAYLDRHAWEEEVIQSFLPTLLVALLALLIPLVLLLIAKKAHTITTLSALHDRIMTRYYKFLIVNVLVFFCVGTAALQSFLLSFRATTSPNLLKVVADSFPTAGPFYVGWLIFTVAIHAGFEISLFGLPLILYPSTRRQVTPRKRAVAIRPRTFNFYYWLPNHLLVIHVLLLFAILNPFVIPFAMIYFFIEAGVVKNQLIHVYAKNYEGNGQVLLIRILRYSLDGMIFSQAVFLAYMVVLKKSVNVGLAAFLIVFTTFVKIFMTRMCRTQFEVDDITEAEIVCNRGFSSGGSEIDTEGETWSNNGVPDGTALIEQSHSHSLISTWRLPAWINFSYKTARHRPHHPAQHRPNPFGPHHQSFSRLGSMPVGLTHMAESPEEAAVTPKTAMISNQPSADTLTACAPIAQRPQWSNAELSGPVVPHPPPISWDDETTCDLPYDNPFFTRTISSVLWLPRDPFGLLDLDDTIDFKTSLTVEPTVGQLGTWFGTPETTSPMPVSIASDGTPKQVPSPPTRFTSSEEIDLPPVIAKRIQAKEGDVERTSPPRRPSTFRKASIGASSGGTSRRRPSVIDGPPPLSFRSLSAGNPDGRGRSDSVMSVLELPPRLNHSRSADHELGIRPDAHAQAELVAANASSSQISLGPPRLKRARNISQAVYIEVMAEEEQALAHRLEEEEAEAEKAKTTKSWLTSWMFKKLA